MNVLFIHQILPGQFIHLSVTLAFNPSYKVVFLTQRADAGLPNIRIEKYAVPQRSRLDPQAPLFAMDNAVLQGKAAALACMGLARGGFRPDIIVSHPAWGDSLFLKDAFPHTPLLNYCEFYHHSGVHQTPTDALGGDDLDDLISTRTQSSHLLSSLESCDRGLSPTLYQRDSHPAGLRDKIDVIFDGTDTSVICPNPAARVTLPDGRVLTPEDEVVTYVARTMEPYRGFPTFMRALPELLRRRPKAIVLIVGHNNAVSYGAPPPGGRTWRQVMEAEVGPLDPRRVIFLGPMMHSLYLDVLRISTVHIYLTIPFVLSWSCIEALSTGCVVVGSRTAPVQEVIEDGVNGFLVDLNSPKEVTDRAVHALEHRAAMHRIRQAARETVMQRYALARCLPQQIGMLHAVAGRG